jgi:hypothetical protein
MTEDEKFKAFLSDTIATGNAEFVAGVVSRSIERAFLRAAPATTDELRRFVVALQNVTSSYLVAALIKEDCDLEQARQIGNSVVVDIFNHILETMYADSEADS